MDLEPFDRAFEEKMFSSSVGPHDLPPGYANVLTLLKRAAAQVPPFDRALADRTIAAMVAAIAVAPAIAVPAPTDRAARRSFLPRRAAVPAAVLALAMLVLGTGLAFAGVLASSLQSAAAGFAQHLGVILPAGNGSTRGGGTSPHRFPGAQVPPAQALPGLCIAYRSGNGGTNGKKNASTAFTRLQTVASAAGQGVGEFCASQGTGRKTAHGKGHKQSSGSHGRSADHGGGGGFGNNRQRQGGTPSGEGSSKRGSHDSSGGSSGSHTASGRIGGSQGQGKGHG